MSEPCAWLGPYPIRHCLLCGAHTIGEPEEPEPFVCRRCDLGLEAAARRGLRSR